MKIAAKIASTFAFLLFSLVAMGGGGSGGTWAKTTLLLQANDYEQAFLSFEGSTTIPEEDMAPQLVIPTDEYTGFLEEYNNSKGGKPFILPVERNGIVHNYELRNANEDGGTVFLVLVEI